MDLPDSYLLKLCGDFDCALELGHDTADSGQQGAWSQRPQGKQLKLHIATSLTPVLRHPWWTIHIWCL